MEKYECAFYIRPFDFDFEEAKKRVTIKFENQPISYDEALRLYYSISDSYFTWDFNFNPVILKERKNDFVVVGDGIRIGTIKKRQLPENLSVQFNLSDLLEKYYIYHLKAFVSYGKYFRLSEPEYKKLVKQDPYNRGFAEWANGRPPHMRLDVIYGTQELTKAEKYLLEKQMRSRARELYGK